MPIKVTISPLGNPENSSFVTELNNAISALASEFDKVVYRDGSFDLTGDLNVNSNRVYNLGEPLSASEALRLEDASGIQGPPGADGVDGTDGADAPLPNWTFATGAAGTEVQVSGTYPNQVITIPRGSPGASGALGDGNYTDITVSGTGSVLTINNGAVSLSKMATLPTMRIIGNNTGGTATPLALTGTQVTAMLDVAGASKGLMSAADFTKLSGIATGATANSTDATLLSRANHTGTQAQSTITNLTTDLAAKASKFMSVVSLNANTTLDDASHANNLLKLTGGVSRVLTLNSTPTAGFSAIISNRDSVSWSISCANGVYKNGATSTTTTITVAAGAHFTVIHEGSGVWTADGSGLS